MNKPTTIDPITASAVKDAVTTLNTLQSRAYRATKSELKTIRCEWKFVLRKLNELGYTIKKKKFCGTVTWYAVQTAEMGSSSRNNECEFIYTDVRPKNRECLKGDCTTRALTYALKGDYTAIENRQYYIAAVSGGLRNQSKNWVRVAEENGFVKISWSGAIKRSVIGRAVRMNGNINRPIITVSSGHCAIVDVDGSVRDTWDSRGGRVKYLLCHKNDTDIMMKVLTRFVYPQLSNPLV